MSTSGSTYLVKGTDPGLRDALQCWDEALDDHWGQPEGELVDDDDLGAGDQRLGEDDHLLLPSRQHASGSAEEALTSWPGAGAVTVRVGVELSTTREATTGEVVELPA